MVDDLMVPPVAGRPAAAMAVALSLVGGTGCFDSSDRFETRPLSSCPASALSTKSRAPARPRVPEPDGGKGIDDGDGALATRVVFAVIGDYGLDGQNEARVARLVTWWDPDFVITTGDNNYFQGEASTIDQNIGKHYCQFIGNYLGKPDEGSLTNRFWPSPGNHDWVTHELRPYLDYFTLPGNERYYDVARGLVHLYSLDSDWNELDGVSENSPQASWLRDRLAASTACFDVVYFHHPPYSSGPHGSSFEMRWPFEAWGADVVMAGHDHTYERFEVGQIPYFTVGLGGASIYDFVTALPETRMQYNTEYGALRVTVDRSGMTFEFVNVLGTVVDTFTSTKDCAAAGGASSRPAP
jgi:tartrate-resistant acid phosphatase type 5